jgi:hypothetical protein
VMTWWRRLSSNPSNTCSPAIPRPSDSDKSRQAGRLLPSRQMWPARLRPSTMVSTLHTSVLFHFSRRNSHHLKRLNPLPSPPHPFEYQQNLRHQRHQRYQRQPPRNVSLKSCQRSHRSRSLHQPLSLRRLFEDIRSRTMGMDGQLNVR